MITKSQMPKNNLLDTLKWAVALSIIVVAVVGNHWYSESYSILSRAIAVVVLFSLALILALQTEKGHQALNFARESNIEVRKVIWPTRQEAFNTTLIVLAATGVLALVLWGLDAILLQLVNFITGV